jgi:hypothetical protein
MLGNLAICSNPQRSPVMEQKLVCGEENCCWAAGFAATNKGVKKF